MPAPHRQPIFQSGDCEIDLARRELRIGGAAAPLGARAMEILEVLVGSGGTLITKENLVHSVWPGAFVPDNTIQVHISAIRRALGPYRALLRTESGRGYRLVGYWAVRQEGVERRPAAILAADVAGYSRLMGKDVTGTLVRLRTHRRELIDPKVAEHTGRIVNSAGDGVLIEFSRVLDAVACAVEVQQGMAARNSGLPEPERIVFRVGINLDDGIGEGGNIHGDGVNIAAQLAGLAEPGAILVSGIVHDQVRGRLDCGFDDIGEQTLKSIARPVRVYRIGPQSPLRDPQPLAGDKNVGFASMTLPDRASIAVLPFQNMSGDPDQEYFVDGMVEEIITALSRIRWLFVIARNSSFTYKGQAIDVKQVGRELGVRYVLEGSVRKARNRVRIAGQLIDAGTGTHLWADRFDGSLEDVFELQDKVASSVAGVIEPTLQAAELARSAGRPIADLTAYDLYLRGSALSFSSARRIPEVLWLMEQSIERDPLYGPALGFAAICCYLLHRDDPSDDPAADRLKGVDFGRRALAVAGDDPGILANAALALAYFGADMGAMMSLVDRALSFNPNYARGWHISGILRHWAGQHDIAIEHIETALRLSPRARVGTSHAVIGQAHFLSRRFDDAVPKLLLAIQEDANNPQPHRCLAACYAHMARLDEAREIIERLRAITPAVISDASYLRDPEQREFFLSGLRLAASDAE